MGAFQGDPIRHYHMDMLVKREAERLGGRPIKILEIGSWAGGSAITWANALKRHNNGLGIVICVDAWRPYFETSGYSDLNDLTHYRKMQKALEDEKIYSLFLHNIRTSGHDDIVVPIRGESDLILPLLQKEGFDLIFVDGAHDFISVTKDLKNCCRLVIQDGIICGDDLELQLHETDIEFGRQHRQMDYICDPLTKKWYHPGVTWGVAEQFTAVTVRDGFWATRYTGQGWTEVHIPAADPKRIKIPPHLANITIPIESNYFGFNIVLHGNRYHGLAISLGEVDLSTCTSFELEEYGRWGKYLVADQLDELHDLILSTGFADAPLLLEENVLGFNIVKFKDRFYALSLVLGPFDLTSATPETIVDLQRQGFCLIAGSISELKRIMNGTFR